MRRHEKDPDRFQVALIASPPAGAGTERTGQYVRCRRPMALGGLGAGQELPQATRNRKPQSTVHEKDPDRFQVALIASAPAGAGAERTGQFVRCRRRGRKPQSRQPETGLTLLELTLAVGVGLVLLAASTFAYRQYRDQTRMNQGKINLATIRQNISMYHYRTGTYPPFGMVAPVTMISGGNQITVNPMVGSSPVASLSVGNVVELLQSGLAPAVMPITSLPGGNVIGVASVPGGFNNTATLLCGIAGNVDDQGNAFLSVVVPTPYIIGMGLGDPWIGYQTVRDPSTSSLPIKTASGYQYSTPASRPGDVWGGLSYDQNSGEVEYVLPDPASATQPPSALGFFPGDPPNGWGK